MSEEKKEQSAPEETAQPEKQPETRQAEQKKDEKPKKEPKESKKKEKTYTLTREQMEAAELAAKRLAAVTDQFTRLTAEYDNYRKRTTREKESVYQDAKADTILPFLAVYDNLERAMRSLASPIWRRWDSPLTPTSATPSCTSRTRALARMWWRTCFRRGSCWATKSSASQRSAWPTELVQNKMICF